MHLHQALITSQPRPKAPKRHKHLHQALITPKPRSQEIPEARIPTQDPVKIPTTQNNLLTQLHQVVQQSTKSFTVNCAYPKFNANELTNQ